MASDKMRKLKLSPFDQAICRVYVRKLFGFCFPNGSRQQEAAAHLRDTLVATVVQYPFVAESVGPDVTAAGRGRVNLEYPSDPPTYLDMPLFVSKTLGKEVFPCTYDEIIKAGAPPSLLHKELFSSLPEHPRPWETGPALGLQASSVEGGLILCFSFHHTVFDGASATAFLEAFARNSRGDASSENPCSASADLQRVQHASSDGRELIDLSSFPEYNPDGHSAAASASPGHDEPIARTLTFKHNTISALKAKVRCLLNQDGDTPSHVFATDCLGALIWLCVMRARRHRLTAAKAAKWCVAVNVRARMQPPLPTTYFGNAVVHVLATADLGRLLDDEANIVDRVAYGASRIRSAVTSVDAAYIDRRLDLFACIHDPTTLTEALKKTVEMGNTGLDFSDWRDQGGDIDFRTPGAGSGIPDWVRKTWSANEGAVNILPRKGGRKGDADWEVLIALRRSEMVTICEELTAGCWLEKWVE